MASFRTLPWVSAVYKFKITIKCIYGLGNVQADILSHWDTYRNHNNTQVNLFKSCTWEEVTSMLWPDFKV